MSKSKLLLVLFLVNMPTVWAQSYPVKPVRLIVPFAPGGGTDLVARDIANKLSETFNQPVVVDNRAGAGGRIATETTARAAPDGYTMVVASSSYLLYPMMSKTSYDSVRDFSPVTQAVSLPLLLVSSATLPVKSVGELITLARAKPGTINYATSGIGGVPHLAGELFQMMTGTQMVHVPYKGGGPAYPDLIAGQVQLLITVIPSAVPHIRNGRVRGLAVTSHLRSKAFSEFPTLNEAGVPGFDVTQWYGFLMPAQTPRTIVDRMQHEVAAALQDPNLIARLVAQGSEPVGNRPEQFAQLIHMEIAKWSKVIKQVHL